MPLKLVASDPFSMQIDGNDQTPLTLVASDAFSMQIDGNEGEQNYMGGKIGYIIFLLNFNIYLMKITHPLNK
jgi:hypothetical protein